jgi:hypothetical protein
VPKHCCAISGKTDLQEPVQSLCYFGIWFSARGLGLLERPRYALESLYIGPADYVGFSTMPHFMLQKTTRGTCQSRSQISS